MNSKLLNNYTRDSHLQLITRNFARFFARITHKTFQLNMMTSTCTQRLYFELPRHPVCTERVGKREGDGGREVPSAINFYIYTYEYTMRDIRRYLFIRIKPGAVGNGAAPQVLRRPGLNRNNRGLKRLVGLRWLRGIIPPREFFSPARTNFPAQSRKSLRASM